LKILCAPEAASELDEPIIHTPKVRKYWVYPGLIQKNKRKTRKNKKKKSRNNYFSIILKYSTITEKFHEYYLK
jgi:hypothetical protein